MEIDTSSFPCLMATVADYTLEGDLKGSSINPAEVWQGLTQLAELEFD